MQSQQHVAELATASSRVGYSSRQLAGTSTVLGTLGDPLSVGH
jgi:hypothetical protein